MYVLPHKTLMSCHIGRSHQKVLFKSTKQYHQMRHYCLFYRMRCIKYNICYTHLTVNLEVNMDTVKNVDFVQFSRKSMLYYQQLISISPLAARVLIVLAEKMDKANAIVISIDTLCEITERSRSNVCKAIKVLREKKYVQCIKVGNLNAYVLNSSVFWTSDAKKRVYSKFNATVLASFKEQGKNFDPDVKIKNLSGLIKKSEARKDGEDEAA